MKKEYNNIEEILYDTLEYYTENPLDRRCIDHRNNCRYSSKSIDKSTSEGCAIGRLFEESISEEIDNRIGEISIDLLMQKEFSLIPDWFKELYKKNNLFFVKLQRLHDTKRYWDNKGLSEEGKEFVRIIIQNNDLSTKRIKRFLQ